MALIIPGISRQTLPLRGYMINKDKLTCQFAEEAVNHGAKLFTETSAVEFDGKAVTLQQRGKRFCVAPEFIVGADGSNSRVSRWIGVANSKYIATVQSTYSHDGPKVDTVEFYFSRGYTNCYAWVFPKPDRVHVGVGISVRFSRNIKQILEEFVAQIRRLGRLKDGQLEAQVAGLIPVNGMLPTIQKENIVLVGDAAGLTDPITCGGNLQAIASGMIAADSIHEAMSRDDHPKMEEYSEKIRAMLGRRNSEALEKRRLLEYQWANVPLQEIIPQAWTDLSSKMPS